MEEEEKGIKSSEEVALEIWVVTLNLVNMRLRDEGIEIKLTDDKIRQLIKKWKRNKTHYITREFLELLAEIFVRNQ